MPPPNIVCGQKHTGFLLFVCSCMCASGNIVNTISCRVFDTFSPTLHQRCIMGQRWMRHSLGSDGQRSRSWWNIVCWKQQCPGLLTRYLEKCESHFHQTYLNDVLWDRDKCLNFGVKRSKFKSQLNNIWWGEGIHYSMSRVELDFLVLFSALL